MENIANVEFTFDEQNNLIQTVVNEEAIEHDYGLFNRRFYPSKIKEGNASS